MDKYKVISVMVWVTIIIAGFITILVNTPVTTRVDSPYDMTIEERVEQLELGESFTLDGAKYTRLPNLILLPPEYLDNRYESGYGLWQNVRTERFNLETHEIEILKFKSRLVPISPEMYLLLNWYTDEHKQPQSRGPV